MPRIRNDWLDTFIAAVESGSFTAAAERVHRSQSAVSLQIGQLELALGRRLLYRGPGGLQPTLDGEHLLPYVRRATEAIEAVSNAFASVEPQLLRIGVPDEYADGVLPEVVARFGRSHPNIMLEVQCAPSRALEERINAGSLDFAVVLEEEVKGSGTALVVDPTCWVASPSLVRYGAGGPVPVAVFDSECSWRRWALDTLKDAGIDYRIAYTSSSVAALRAAIRSGIAVGLMGASTVTDDIEPFPPFASIGSMPASRLIWLGLARSDDVTGSTLQALMADALAARQCPAKN